MLQNIRETPDQKIYITSDFHLGHQKDFVWEARGYANPNEHTKGIVSITNEIVRPNDVLIFLGDWCLNTTIDQFNETLDMFKCQNIYALWGNHNNPHEKGVYKKLVGDKFETYPFKYKNMTYYGYYMEAILNGQYCVLCHYPIWIWNEMAHGAWMLCGHSHYGFPSTQAESDYGKILDLGWDGHNKPWTLEEIKEVMDTKGVPIVDHHK